MERHCYSEDFSFEETTGYGDYVADQPEEEQEPCVHAFVKTADWDFGIDRETGYHDCGTEVTCLGCGEIWSAEDYQEMLAETTLQEARKPVTSERFTVEQQEVA